MERPILCTWFALGLALVLSACPAPSRDAGPPSPEVEALDAGRTEPNEPAPAPEPEPQPIPESEPEPLEPVPAPPEDCGDDEPLTNASWVGFCEDRVDDNCTNEQRSADCVQFPAFHSFCQTGDEECPTTQPASGPPSFDCLAPPPSNVIAFATLDAPNAQVDAFCIYVYESEAVPGEHYVAVDVTDGSDPSGPDAKCADDYSARRHLFFSDLLTAQGEPKECAPVRYSHAYPEETLSGDFFPVDDQKLSNSCRKAIRNIVRSVQSNFDPDIQYFAASRQEALAKLAILDTAEVACLGIDNLAGEPYRENEVWISQGQGRLMLTEHAAE